METQKPPERDVSYRQDLEKVERKVLPERKGLQQTFSTVDWLAL
jgi:hypothetical protein